jgi:Holliday junction resolvase RusA-like endonuclease
MTARSNPGSLSQGAVASGRGGGPATAAAASGPQRLVFMVPGEPIPKARPRVVRGGTYTPPRTTQAEGRIREYLKVAYPHLRPSESAYAVTLEFQFKGVGRGDWDNYAKLVCDALNGIVWMDDRQIRRADVVLRRNFVDPCTIVTISSLRDDEDVWP